MIKKLPLPLDKSYRLLNHGPVILVTCFDGKRPNIMPVAWSMPVDLDPPVVAVCIGDHSYTFSVIKKTKEFTINIPAFALLPIVKKCGKCHGNEVDKFKEFKLTPLPSKKVKSPWIKECFAHLECKVTDSKFIKTHNLFISKVIAAYADAGAFADFLQVGEKQFKTIHHLGGNYFTAPDGVEEV